MRSSGLPATASVLDALTRPTPPHPNQRPDRAWVEIMDPIIALHRSNREQWEREDDARTLRADDVMVAAAKRDIDRLNASRHGLIEAIDRAILETIGPCPEAPLVTESPGMAIDRLSVLIIRLASTESRVMSGAADAQFCAERIPRLQGQLHALEEAIDRLFLDLSNGARRFFAHEGLKLYGPGDPGRAG